MSTNIEKLRAALAQSRLRPGPSAYPPKLRIEATLWLRSRRAAGEGWAALGRELGISGKTAQDWAQRAQRREEGSASFLPIHLSDEAAAAPHPAAVSRAESTALRSPDLVLFTPRGYRVQGLDADLLMAVLERVG